VFLSNSVFPVKIYPKNIDFIPTPKGNYQGKIKLKVSCQNIDFSLSWKELRLPIDTLAIQEPFTSFD
jgi:hypothetical protein